MGSAAMDSLLQSAPGLLAKLPAKLLAKLLAKSRRLWTSVKIRRRERSLRLCETLSLGEKRLVAVLECERQRYLIGITNQSIVLLHDLGESKRLVNDARQLPGESR